jgi:hypothetical protein
MARKLATMVGIEPTSPASKSPMLGLQVFSPLTWFQIMFSSTLFSRVSHNSLPNPFKRVWWFL